MATRRYGTIVRHLKEDPDTAAELAAKLPDDQLIELAAALRDEMQQRARASGDAEIPRRRPPPRASPSTRVSGTRPVSLEWPITSAMTARSAGAVPG